MWAFEDAKAVIFSDEGEETHVEAARGELDQNSDRAVLSQGVNLRVGDLEVRLEDLEWLNEERVAQSARPVHLVDGETVLDAAAMRLYPDDDMFVLQDVEGVIDMGRAEE